MLLRYIVSNYKSIGHSVEFSMFPVESSTDERFLATINTKAGKWKILKRGAFFGPNASGKSSFMESIWFARNYIINPQKSGNGTKVDQFKGVLDDLNGKSTFQFMFYMDGEVYEYCFSIDREQVYEEWLTRLTKTTFLPIFTRITNAEGKTDINTTAKLTRDENTRKLVDILKSSIQENQRNQLFLYKLSENGIDIAEKIVSWFKNLQLIFPDTKIQALPIQVSKDEQLKDYLSQMLNKMDTGVFELTIASEEIDFHEYAEKIALPKKIIDEIEDTKNGIVNLNGRYFVFGKSENKRTVMIQLKFNHRLANKIVSFNMEDESDGTQRLLDLLPMIFMAEKRAEVFFVDEIDRSLHTKLSQYLLDEFVKNNENSQIIFTAHDVNLINLKKFRQDEIWFIEKNKDGESKLKPLSDFQINEKQDEDVLKSYLSGRFGAVPTIKGE